MQSSARVRQASPATQPSSVCEVGVTDRSMVGCVCVYGSLIDWLFVFISSDIVRVQYGLYGWQHLQGVDVFATMQKRSGVCTEREMSAG